MFLNLFVSGIETLFLQAEEVGAFAEFVSVKADFVRSRFEKEVSVTAGRYSPRTR